MPVSLDVPIRRLSQQQFGELSYEVMAHVFAIHSELGRYFDEKIYKRELAHRVANVHVEVPVDVTLGAFHARYYLDMLVADGGLFELKTAESLSPKHRAQLLNYLLLCDLNHGKFINVRTESVEHEFVNTHWNRAARTQFEVDTARWDGKLPGARQLYDFLISSLLDIGTGLEVSLYAEAVTHCFGGQSQVEVDIPVAMNGHSLGVQRMRLIAPGVAFKLTSFDERLDPFEIHARRLLQHTNLHAIAWINIALKQVTLVTLQR